MANRYATATAVQTGGAPVTMGPAGFWLDANGDVAATDPSGTPQVTPGMQNNPQGTLYYDQAKDLYYNIINGKPQYLSPYDYNQTPGAQGSGHGETNPSGSLLTTGGTWDPTTGSFQQGVAWGNILSLVIAGVITGGVADAIMAGGDAAAVASSAGLDPAVTSQVTAAAGADTAAGATTLAPEAAQATVASATAGGVATGAAAVTPEAAAVAPEAAGTGLVAGATPAETAAALGPTSGTASWLAPTTSTTGLITAGAISAGAGLTGALISSNATENGQQLQAAAVAAALAYQKQLDQYNAQVAAATELYTTQNAAYQYQNKLSETAPYRANAYNAGVAMAAALGLPAPPAQAPLGTQPTYAPPPAFNPYATPPPAATAVPRIGAPAPGSSTPPAAPATGGTPPAAPPAQRSSVARILLDPTTGQPTAPTPTTTPSAPTGTVLPDASGGMAPSVILKGPDGSLRTVPAADVPFWLARGATQATATV